MINVELRKNLQDQRLVRGSSFSFPEFLSSIF